MILYLKPIIIIFKLIKYKVIQYYESNPWLKYFVSLTVSLNPCVLDLGSSVSWVGDSRGNYSIIECVKSFFCMYHTKSTTYFVTIHLYTKWPWSRIYEASIANQQKYYMLPSHLKKNGWVQYNFFLYIIRR